MVFVSLPGKGTDICYANGAANRSRRLLVLVVVAIWLMNGLGPYACSIYSSHVIFCSLCSNLFQGYVVRVDFVDVLIGLAAAGKEICFFVFAM